MNMEQKQKVLVADDDPDILNLVKVCLESRFDVICARNGEQALEMAIAEKPIAAVLDLRMPKLDGNDVTAKIRQIPEISNMAIMILTASVQEQNEAESYSVGADTFCRKPFRANNLADDLQKVIDKRHT